MRRFFSFALLIMGIIMGMSAQTAQKILALQKNNNTYTSSFVETKVMPKLKKETKKTGSLTWTAPETLRLSYTDPAGDYTEIGPNVFNLCQGGEVKKLPARDNNTKLGLLRQTLILAFKGDVEKLAALNGATITYDEKGANYTCVLTSAQPKHGVKELKLLYDKKTGHLVSLTITETNGNYTTWAVK